MVLATDDTSSGSSIGTAWFDNGSSWSSAWNPPSRGASIVATSQSTGSTSFTTLATPDQVTGIVLPTNGLIQVFYQATWQESVIGGAQAAIFLGSNQAKAALQNVASPVVIPAFISGSSANVAVPLATNGPGGLASLQGTSGGLAYTGDVTTGQFVAGGSFSAAGGLMGGPCYLFAAAGTYTVSVQFKASSGTVTVSNRRLYVQALPYA